MTILKLVSAGVILTAVLAVPAMAREGSGLTRRVSDANAAAPDARKRGCVRAPDVGAYASAPWRRPPCEPGSRY